MPPRVDGSLSAASFLLSIRDVNYIAVLYGQVTDSNDPEHVFSVVGVEWWNVEGHYVRFSPRGGGEYSQALHLDIELRIRKF